MVRETPIGEVIDFGPIYADASREAYLARMGQMGFVIGPFARLSEPEAGDTPAGD